jgi:hypothetical protein
MIIISGLRAGEGLFEDAHARELLVSPSPYGLAVRARIPGTLTTGSSPTHRARP